MICQKLSEYNIEEALNNKSFWEADNGLTLCDSCHIDVDDYRNNFARKHNSGAPTGTS